MDLQILLIFILAILTVTLVAAGIYLILVLKEFRQTIVKANGILENVETISNAITNPLSIVTGAVKGFKAFKKFYKEE